LPERVPSEDLVRLLIERVPGSGLALTFWGVSLLQDMVTVIGQKQLGNLREVPSSRVRLIQYPN
jgi:hypothetical protein